MASQYERYSQVRITVMLLLYGALIADSTPAGMLGLPQLIQRQHLEYGICKKPLAIAVCLESCMADSAIEFAMMTQFANVLIHYFSNVQSTTLKMAINYCSGVQQWVDWTSSTEVFASHVSSMTQLYAYNVNNALGPNGPFGAYGMFTPLQPAAGVCLERVRASLANLPPFYQPLVILLTSGRSSNSVRTIQQAQAIMYDGAEIFAITELNGGVSEELRLSVSGPSYFLTVRDMNLLGKTELDAVITNVCKIERSQLSARFPINVVGSFQPTKTPFVIPPILPQIGDQIRGQTMATHNITRIPVNFPTVETFSTETAETLSTEPTSTTDSGTFNSETTTSEIFNSETTPSGTFNSETTPSDTFSAETISTETTQSGSFPTNTNVSEFSSTTSVSVLTSDTVSTETLPFETTTFNSPSFETISTNSFQSQTVSTETPFTETTPDRNGSAGISFTIGPQPGNVAAENRNGINSIHAGNSSLQSTGEDLHFKVVLPEVNVHDALHGQNGAIAESGSGVDKDGCVDTSNMSDSSLRLKMIQDGRACDNNATLSISASVRTPEPRCTNVTNIKHPLLRLGVILVNLPRQLCPENITGKDASSIFDSQIKPQNTLNDTNVHSVNELAGSTQSSRICVDLSNAFDLYKLGVLLAQWSQAASSDDEAKISQSGTSHTVKKPEKLEENISTSSNVLHYLASTLKPPRHISVSATTSTSTSLCQGSTVVNDAGFNPAPNTCTAFVLCSQRSSGGTWTHHDIISCPPGLYWSQNKLTCVRPEDASCVNGNS